MSQKVNKIKNITMPQLGESAIEGTIIRWLVKPGDQVKAFEAIAEVESDKVTTEIPSTDAGIIQEIFAQALDTVRVNQPICSLAIQTEHSQTQEENLSEKVIPAKPISDEQNYTHLYTPVVLQLAQYYGVDLNQVPGTGIGYRISKKDILSYLKKYPKGSDNGFQLVNGFAEQRHSSDVAMNLAPVEIKTNLSTYSKTKDKSQYMKSVDFFNLDTLLGKSKGVVGFMLSPLRKTIANHFEQATRTIPHGWMSEQINVTPLVEFQKKYKEQFYQDYQYKLTYFPFFLKAVAYALKLSPLLNSIWQSDAVLLEKEINLSIAVANGQDLYTPVILDVPGLSIIDLVKRIEKFKEKAKTHTFVKQDLMGGTFTVNNTGSFGSHLSMGIVNSPQAAILQVEKIQQLPYVEDDQIVIQSRVNLCVSVDHRIIDGYAIGQFLGHIKHYIQQLKEQDYSYFIQDAK